MTGVFTRLVLAAALVVLRITIAHAETPLADPQKMVTDMETILALPAKTAALQQALSGSHLTPIHVSFECWTGFRKVSFEREVSYSPSEQKLRYIVDQFNADADMFLQKEKTALGMWRMTVNETRDDFNRAASILTKVRERNASGTDFASDRHLFRSFVKVIHAHLKVSATALDTVQTEMAKFTHRQQTHVKGIVDWQRETEQVITSSAGTMSKDISGLSCKGSGPQQLEAGRAAALGTLRNISKRTSALAADVAEAEAAGRRLSGALEALIAQYAGVETAINNAEGSKFASLVQKIRFDTGLKMFSDLAALAR